MAPEQPGLLADQTVRAYQNKTSPTDSDSPSHQSSRRIGWCMGSGVNVCLLLQEQRTYILFIVYSVFVMDTSEILLNFFGI